MSQATSFVVLATARTGSNMLVDYIAHLHGIWCCVEVFKRPFRQQDEWGEIEALFSSADEYERLFSNDTPGCWNRIVTETVAAANCGMAHGLSNN